MGGARGNHQRGEADVIGLLDIGTSKVACAIAERRTGPSGLTVLGFASRPARGMKGGFVVDFDEAEAAVRCAVDAAEQQAGVRVREVLATVACGRPTSRHFTVNASLPAGAVTAGDLERALNAGRAHGSRDGRRLIHLNKIAVRLDGAASSDEPRDMAASRLAMDLHAVSAEDRPVSNLLTVLGRCYLDVVSLVAAPYASALGCTTEEERGLGVTCIDIGAGATSVAVFRESRFVYADTIPFAGNHITHDIARALDAPLAKAGRIKALYGALIDNEANRHEVFSYPSAGGEGGVLLQASKACMARIIQPRLVSIARLVADRLAGARLAPRGGRVVVTGGTSQLLGIGEVLGRAFGQPVRVAGPLGMTGSPWAEASPAFSALSGLFRCVANADWNLAVDAPERPLASGYLGRVGQWLKAAF